MESYSKLRFWCKTDNRWTGPSGSFKLLSLAKAASLFGKPLEVVCGILAFWAPHLKTSAWISSSSNFLKSGPSPSTCLIPFSVDSYHLCLRLDSPLPKPAKCIASPTQILWGPSQLHPPNDFLFCSLLTSTSWASLRVDSHSPLPS